jgi:hypothetical protein
MTDSSSSFSFQFGLGFLIIDAHSSLSNAFALHCFTPGFLQSSSTSSIHLSLGHPLPLLPSNFPSNIFFTDLVSFILITCPSHSNLLMTDYTISFGLMVSYKVNILLPFMHAVLMNSLASRILNF